MLLSKVFRVFRVDKVFRVHKEPKLHRVLLDNRVSEVHREYKDCKV